MDRVLRKISESLRGLNMKDDKNLVEKIVAGIGVAVAGTFIAKRLFRNRKEEGEREKANPLLTHLGKKTNAEVVAMYLQREQTRMSMHTVMPLPKDYANKLTEIQDDEKSQLYKRAIFAKDNYRYHEARDLLDRLAATDVGGSEKAALAILSGNCFYNTGMFDSALHKYVDALEDARTGGDKEAEAAALGNTGIAYLHKFSLEKARRYCEDSLAVYKELGLEDDQADQLSNLSLIYRKSGEPDVAIKNQEDALKISRHKKDHLKEAAGLGNLGLAWQQKGDAHKALECFQHAHKIFIEEKNRKGEAEQLGNMGGAYQQKGDMESAMKYEEDALAIHREIGNVDGEANQLGNIGLLYQQNGEYDKAIGYFGDAMRLHKQVGNQNGEATGLVNMGVVYRKTGDLNRAMECQRKALKMFTEMGAKAQTDIIKQNIKKIQEMMIIRKVDFREPEEER